jgi:hypothetical protein
MSDLDPERLPAALHDLAGQVHNVDLRERTLRTSHRIGVRRAVLATAAVVVALGLTGAGLAKVLPREHALPGPGNTVEPTSPAPQVTDSPTVGPTAKPSGTPAYSPDPVSGIPNGPRGTAFYVDPNPPSERAKNLFAWAIGQPTTVWSYRLLPHAASSNANVSPDRHWLSWVEATDVNGVSPLHVLDLRTGQDRILRQSVDDICQEPAWAPDSRRLLVADGTNQTAYHAGVVDVTTGAFTRLPTDFRGCHPMWAVDGTAIVYANGTGKIMVANADGSNQRAVPGIGAAPNTWPQSYDLESASAGGARVSLYLIEKPTEAGDAERSLYSNAVLDTRTGRKVALPVAGQLLQAVYRADGTLLVRIQGTGHNQLVLLSASNTVLWQQDEPSSLRNMMMLST